MPKRDQKLLRLQRHTQIPPGFNLCHKFHGHTEKISQVIWSADGNKLVSSSQDRTVLLWDNETGKQLDTLRGHAGSVLGVAWSPHGKILASCSEDKTIQLWDGETGEKLQTLTGHYGAVL